MSLWWQPLFVPSAGAAVPTWAAALTKPATIVRRPYVTRTRTVRPPTVPIVIGPLAGWLPIRVARMPWRNPAHHPRGRSFMPPRVIADAFTPPIGPAGVATFAMNIEEGATATYEWPSVVRKMSSGIETRASLVRTPRQEFEFTAVLSDAQHRAILATLAQYAASAPTFLLGLPFEELTITGSTSTAIAVTSLASCDWAVAGQRIVVVGLDGTTVAETWINGAPGGVTIPVGSDVSALAVDGARVMPAVAVKLEADQGFDRERVGLGHWKLVASAAQNGFGATTQFGAGASVTMHDGLPVWDRGIASQNAAQPLLSDISKIDSGTDVADAMQLRSQADWTRAVRIESVEPTPDWQWFKAFLLAVKGRARTFLLPTGRPDLVAESDASTGTLTISGADYVNSWFRSTAHRRIRIVFTDGSYAYRTVTAAIDNLDGTQDLTLASAAAGTIDRIELLELARLQSDEIAVRWSGYSFEASFTAQVVQQ